MFSRKICDCFHATFHIQIRWQTYETKNMRKSERIIGGIVIALMIIRLFIYSTILDKIIVILTMLLSLVYFGLSFTLLNNIRLREVFKKESYKGISALKIIGTIGTGIILSMICIYCLFKFMRWPMANSGLIISLISLTIPIIITAIKALLSKSKFYSKFLIRLLIFGVIGTTFYFIPTVQILEMKNRHFPEYIDAEKKLMQNPQNKELQKKVFEERKKKNAKD